MLLSPQVGGFAVLFVCIFLWLGVFFQQGFKPARMPAFGNSFGSVLSVVIFNFGYVMTIPSWLNEKKVDVSVHKSIWTSVAIGVVVFLALGIFGGLSLDYDGGDLIAAVDNLGSKAVSCSLQFAMCFLRFDCGGGRLFLAPRSVVCVCQFPSLPT